MVEILLVVCVYLVVVSNSKPIEFASDEVDITPNNIWPAAPLPVSPEDEYCGDSSGD